MANVFDDYDIRVKSGTNGVRACRLGVKKVRRDPPLPDVHCMLGTVLQQSWRTGNRKNNSGRREPQFRISVSPCLRVNACAVLSVPP